MPRGLDAAARDAETGSWDAIRDLTAALLAIETSADVESGNTALGWLAQHPRAIARLDGLARHELWPMAPFRPVIEQLVRRVPAGPVGVALLSTHWDGRVREQAVRRMVERPSPGSMPFLVLRTGDWVRQVRDRARAGLALLLHERPEDYLVAAVDMAVLLAGRLRGSFATDQVRAAALRRPRELWYRLHPAASRVGRRIVFDAVLFTRQLRIAELTDIAESDPDPAVRARAAETVVREALWTTRIEQVRRLARSRHRAVRALALTGLMRAGQPAEAATFLDDPGTLVRAIARDAARRSGVDPLAHYRNQVADDPPVGAIDGLAEIGGATDGDLLLGLLEHPTPRVRAHAVRGLRALDVTPVEPLVALLRDPSTAVIREAAAALVPAARTLPTGLLWDMLADPDRPARRRASYLLLQRHGPVTRLRAALLLAVDPHPPMASRGVADTTRIARFWRRGRAWPLDPDPRQAADLRQLLDNAATAIGPDTTRLLLDQLEHAPRA